MKKNLALVAGGYQSEAVVSYKSAEQVAKMLDSEKFNIYIIHITKENWLLKNYEEDIEINKNDFSFEYQGQKTTFDFSFVIIHGTPGEDGKLQAYFEMLNIPCSTGNFFNMALTFNKYACKQYLKNYNIHMAKSVILRKGQKYNAEEIISELGLPMFVKPNQAGSSFGISKVKSINELPSAINNAFSEDNEIIIEEFLEGTEVTCGVLKTKEKEYLLPLTEIVSKNEFFDYEAKYTTGMAEEITPARITADLTKAVQKISSQVYDILDCKGVVRMDYIIRDNQPCFIEVNTVPGMSANSIIPQMIECADINISNFLNELISAQTP